MDKLIICETDRGRYAVRPVNWAGIWNEKGQIKESLNHLALFIKKEDAEKFVEWENAEEQGKLLKLPCAVGNFALFANGVILPVVYITLSNPKEGISIGCQNGIRISMNLHYGSWCKGFFKTREEAEAVLKELGDKKA